MEEKKALLSYTDFCDKLKIVPTYATDSLDNVILTLINLQRLHNDENIATSYYKKMDVVKRSNGKLSVEIKNFGDLIDKIRIECNRCEIISIDIMLNKSGKFIKVGEILPSDYIIEGYDPHVVFTLNGKIPKYFPMVLTHVRFPFYLDIKLTGHTTPRIHIEYIFLDNPYRKDFSKYQYYIEFTFPHGCTFIANGDLGHLYSLTTKEEI